MRILVIEDDKTLSSLITDILEKENYVCDPAFDLQSAKAKLEDDSFDAVLLDIVLPDGNGVEFCGDLRSSGFSTPIIMLTGKRSTKDKVGGLDAGADDYIQKPFSPNELKARLRAVLRRPKQTLAKELVCGDLTLDLVARTVQKNGDIICLMPKEYSLLEYLMRKKNEAVKKEELLRHVWGVYSRTGTNRLEVYVRYLREKLDLPFKTNSIQTVRGVGYRISEPEL